MTRLELYHNKPKKFSWKGTLLACLILTIFFVAAWYYYVGSIHINSPKDNFGRKVVIQLPSGQTVYTFENLLTKKGRKIYYKGDTNTIDLTGGTITYENWK